jgi:hypothetical protein
VSPKSLIPDLDLWEGDHPTWIREYLFKEGPSRWRHAAFRVGPEHPILQEGWVCERCGSDMIEGSRVLLTWDGSYWGAKHHRCPLREKGIFEFERTS